jgi:hypothetical protein
VVQTEALPLVAGTAASHQEGAPSLQEEEVAYLEKVTFPKEHFLANAEVRNRSLQVEDHHHFHTPE